MRRFVSLAVILFFAIPFGMSVSGCKKGLSPEFCSAGDSGPVVGQAAFISLSPSLATTGESLSYGQIGQSLSATATDCKGSSVSVRAYTYATSNMYVADINPTTGQVCAGQWNRFTGGGVPDYTTCNPFTSTNQPAPVTTSVFLSTPTASAAGTPSISQLTLASIADTISGTVDLAVGTNPSAVLTVASGTSLGALATEINSNATYQAQGITASASTNTTSGTETLTISGPATASSNLVITGSSLIDTKPAYLAYVTASADGITSNAIPVYIHPVVTGVVLVPAAGFGATTAACSAGGSSYDPDSSCCPTNLNNVTYSPTPAAYSAQSCYSQGNTVLVGAKVYANGQTNAANNITCQVGHITFTGLTGGIVSFDENGVATPSLPGSTIVTADVSNSSTASSAGYFSTCPPASIALSIPGQTTNSVNIPLNNTQPLTAAVTDTNGHQISGLTLEYASTSPQTVPTPSGATVTPAFPGAATITAACQPPSCNPSPFSELGYLGNGKPITSNGITITTGGTSSTVLYAASTNSQYLFPYDFSTGLAGSLVKLPYVPNSMVITQDGSTIYLGSSVGLMSVVALTNSVSSANSTVPGTVLAVSPDGTTVVITDPVRQTVSLYSTSASAVTTSEGGVGTKAIWSQDSQTVYITLQGGGLLTHSNYANWQTTASPNYVDATITVPGIGAYFAASNETDGRSYCSSTTTTGGNSSTPPTVTNAFAPLADTKTISNDKLASTTDGKHILGAVASQGAPTLNDLDFTPPAQTCPAPPNVVSPGYFTSSNNALPLSGITAPAGSLSITGVVPSTNSALAFVTYANSGATGTPVLPYYVIPSSGAGTVGYLTLKGVTGQAVAPTVGVFSTDNTLFYAGTSGASGTSADNAVHIFSITGTTPAETGILTPNLPAASGGVTFAPINLMAQRPKKSTS